MLFKRALIEMMKRSDDAARAAFRPAPTKEVVRPEEIELARWAELEPERRAAARGIALVQLAGDHFLALIVDAETSTATWLVTGGLEELPRYLHLMVSSGADRSLPVVIENVGMVCPPFCPKMGIDIGKDRDPDHGLPPGLVLMRARLIERAIAAGVATLKTEAGESIGLLTPG